MSEQPSSDWYRTFFTELPNEFWRRAATPEMTTAEIDFVERQIELPPGSRVLDVPCGSGRHSVALAVRGHRVTGVDISPEAIDHARRLATEAAVEVDFTVADMRDIPVGAGFAAVLCLGNSFGYLDPADQPDFVAALGAAVQPGGALVVDFSATAETVLPGLTSEPRTMPAGDITVRARTEYDVAASRLLSHYTFTRGAQVETATAIHHVYTSGHLGAMLRAAGFTDIERFAGPDGAPYQVGSARLLLTARRR